MAISKKSRKLVNNYIFETATDKEDRCKANRLRLAGFDDSTVAKQGYRVESGLYFKEQVNKMNNKVGTLMDILLDDIQDKITDEKIRQELPAKDLVLMFKSLAEIKHKFSPQLQVTEGNDNKIKRSIWTAI